MPNLASLVDIPPTRSSSNAGSLLLPTWGLNLGPPYSRALILLVAVLPALVTVTVNS
jgi:hypothetical protein